MQRLRSTSNRSRTFSFLPASFFSLCQSMKMMLIGHSIAQSVHLMQRSSSSRNIPRNRSLGSRAASGYSTVSAFRKRCRPVILRPAKMSRRRTSSQKLMSGLRLPGADRRRNEARGGRLRRPEPGHDEEGAGGDDPEDRAEDSEATHPAERREGDEDEVHERNRNEGFPPERHELVEPVARERPAEPDVDEEEGRDLHHVPEDARHDVEERERRHVREGTQPAAEEQRGRDRRDRDHVRVLGQEEDRPAEARVLGVEPGDELALGFREVERDAVRLRDPRDEVEEERDETREDEPHVVRALRLDDLDEGERTRHQDRAHDREAHRDLVADELRRRAETPEERVLRVRRPAAEDDPVNPDRRDREDEEERDVQVRRVPRRRDLPEARNPHRELGAPREYRENREARDHHENRREEVDEVLRLRGDDVLLREELDDVRDPLEDTMRSDAVRALAHLEERERPALDVREDPRRRGHEDHDHDRFDGRDQEVVQDAFGDVHDYLSTSPRTMSIVPMIATRSDTMWPRAI